MSLAFAVYLIGVLNPVFWLSVLGLVISVVTLAIAFFERNEPSGDEFKRKDGEGKKLYIERMQTYMKYAIRCTIVFALIIVFVPDKKDGYLIAGAYVTQKVYESPETAKIQEKVLVIINAKLDEYIPKKESK